MRPTLRAAIPAIEPIGSESVLCKGPSRRHYLSVRDAPDFASLVHVRRILQPANNACKNILDESMVSPLRQGHSQEAMATSPKLLYAREATGLWKSNSRALWRHCLRFAFGSWQRPWPLGDGFQRMAERRVCDKPYNSLGSIAHCRLV